MILELKCIDLNHDIIVINGAVQNSLAAAYDELKNEYSQNFFDKEFNDLNDEQKEIIKIILPQRIADYP